jgi:hypothetical protein
VQRIASRAARQLPQASLLHYSIKANPMPALVQHMAGLVDGLDVASSGELKVALDAGMAPGRISFAGPGKSEAELAQAIAAGVCMNIESERELASVARIGETLGIAPRMAMRVNPDFELKSSGMKMGGGAKPFGIDAEEVPRVLREVTALGLDFQGFHIFSGSQSLRADAIIDAQARSIELALRWPTKRRELRQLNIGGGFGIPYFPGEQRLDVAPIAAAPGRLAAAPRSGLAAGTPGAGTGPLPGGRKRRVRGARDRPQGLARRGVPGHRWRHAPSPGGLRQPWARSSARIIRSRSATAWRRTTAVRRPSPVPCARRSTCWPTAWNWRMPRSAT